MMRRLALLSASLVALTAAAPAGAVDWTAVPGKQVILFHPGQSSWEYMLTIADHSGAERFKEGKNCRACHGDEEKNQGILLSSGQKNEPNPMQGRAPFISANVKFAHDDKALYVRLEFAEGQQYDTHMDKDWATKVSMMLADSNVPEAARAGCWIACHEDAARMPASQMSDRHKYLGKTHAKLSRAGGGDVLKSPEELAKLEADGYRLEYWQARINDAGKGGASAGIVFDKRQESKIHPVQSEVQGDANGRVVILSRPLAVQPPFKSLVAGTPYTVGFAIHAGHTAQRFHYVTYEYTLVLGPGNGDFVSVRQ